MYKVLSVAVLSLAAIPTISQAALVTFESFAGNFGLSNDGFGAIDGNGIISASVPDGSSVTAAFLYTATQQSTSLFDNPPTSVTFDGASVSYDQSNPNPAVSGTLASHRADVTAQVASVVASGGAAPFDFTIDEGASNSAIDGHALVVVYENPALPFASIGILDGFAAAGGDTTTINFSDALSPSDPDFFAELSLGINFGFQQDVTASPVQFSEIDVNGQTLSRLAGNFDDGEAANGALITVGGFDDPLSSGPEATNATDNERYDISDFISEGDTSIVVDTNNPSNDDNIFLATFFVSGNAGFNAPPHRRRLFHCQPAFGCCLQVSVVCSVSTVERQPKKLNSWMRHLGMPHLFLGEV